MTKETTAFAPQASSGRTAQTEHDGLVGRLDTGDGWAPHDGSGGNGVSPPTTSTSSHKVVNARHGKVSMDRHVSTKPTASARAEKACDEGGVAKVEDQSTNPSSPVKSKSFYKKSKRAAKERSTSQSGHRHRETKGNGAAVSADVEEGSSLMPTQDVASAAAGDGTHTRQSQAMKADGGTDALVPPTTAAEEVSMNTSQESSHRGRKGRKYKQKRSSVSHADDSTSSPAEIEKEANVSVDNSNDDSGTPKILLNETKTLSNGGKSVRNAKDESAAKPTPTPPLVSPDAKSCDNQDSLQGSDGAATTNNGRKKNGKWNYKRSKNNRSKKNRKNTFDPTTGTTGTTATTTLGGSVAPNQKLSPQNFVPMVDGAQDMIVNHFDGMTLNETMNPTNPSVMNHASTFTTTVVDELNDAAAVSKDSDSNSAKSNETDSVVITNAAGKALLQQLSSSTGGDSHSSGPYSPVPTFTSSTTSYMNMGGKDDGEEQLTDVSCIGLRLEHGREHFIDSPVSPNDSSFDSLGGGYSHHPGNFHPIPPPPHMNMQFVPTFDGSSFVPYGGPPPPLPYMPMPVPMGPDGSQQFVPPPPPHMMYGPPHQMPFGFDPTYSYLPPPPLQNPEANRGSPSSLNGKKSSALSNSNHTQLNYEQVSVRGCVFFQPVLDVPLGDGGKAGGDGRAGSSGGMHTPKKQAKKQSKKKKGKQYNKKNNQSKKNKE